MDFKIQFKPKYKGYLSKQEPILLMGSCFAEYQSEKFAELCFPVLSNPFGIIYNPVSALRIFQRIYLLQHYNEADFIEYKGQWFSFEHHGHFKYATRTEALTSSNEILEKAHLFIHNASTILITYGTSLVYEKSQNIVANCHKMPANEFGHRQLTMEECSIAIKTTEETIKHVSPHANIIFTISPVRHLRSGLEENFISKSILRAALHNAAPSADYFPAYEIFMDELRDYRFAGEDMTHPNKQAQEYIFQRFIEAYCNDALRERLAQIEKYRKLQAHIPIHSEEAHAQTLRKMRSALKLKYPDVVL